MQNGEPDLLTGLTAAEQEAVLSQGVHRAVASGEELFHLGAAAENLYVIERGRIKLTLPMQVRGSARDVLVEDRGHGQTVGWSALIPPYRFTLTATALVDSEVIALPREILIEFFASSPVTGQRVTLNLASVIGQRLQLFQTMWLREMQRTVELRCA